MCDDIITGNCPRCSKECDFDRPEDCYCLEDEGAGYTYSDEHGACGICEEEEVTCPHCGCTFMLDDLE
jgi:hypothetical protein